ncbi:MAG: spermidine synthase family protein [Victivallaceae bacterium]
MEKTWNKLLTSSAVFCIGMFSMLVQTLLFRDFLSVFDGSEISAGLFLFSWLLWICGGALIAWLPPLSKHARRCFVFLMILYPLAFLMEKYLLLNTRQLLGVAEYELISLNKLAIAAVFFAAPVSIVTGALFVLAVKWVGAGPSPTAKIYIVEALGSFSGALAVTLMLAAGIADETIFLLAAAAISATLGLGLFQREKDNAGKLRKLPYFTALMIAAIALMLGVSGFGTVWQGMLNRTQWLRMLPGGEYSGSFTTPQAKYLCGNYSGSFTVLCWNSVYENLTDREAALQCAALNLAQQPSAERILVIGPGTFNLSRTFCGIKGVRQVVWLDPDPDYSKKLRRLPKQYLTVPEQMRIPEVEIKDYLRTAQEKFDLVILCFPLPSTLSLNRYFSREFYQLVSRVMTKTGVIGVSFQGGENYLSPEISFLGGSLLLNLQRVFPAIVLMPGENSCFWGAFKTGIVSDSSSILEKRLNEVSGLSKIFPSEYLQTAFDPLRTDMQMDKYRNMAERLRRESLSSSDSNPLACLFAMVFSIKKLGGTQLSATAITAYAGDILPVCVIALALYGAVRLMLRYFMRRKPHLPEDSLLESDVNISSFDVLFTLFFISIIAMALNIWLMFAFQMDKGSIFLYFGLVNAFFMLGLFCGGNLTDFLQNRKHGRFCSFTSASLGFILFLVLLKSISFGSLPVWIFALLFFGTGFFSGTYLPRAAYVFKQRGHGDTATAAVLETLDNLGGAIGGIITVIILLPLLGTDRLLILAIASLMLILVLAYLPAKKWSKK